MKLLTIIALASTVLLAACAPQTQQKTGTIVAANGMTITYLDPKDTVAIQFRHVDAVNAIRQSRGLQPVTLNPELNAASLTHARDMAAQNRAWHFGSDGTSPQSRAYRAGYSGLLLSENIAETFEDDLKILQAWMKSNSERSGILMPNATSIGFDWFQENNGKLWFVQLLGDSNTPAPKSVDPNASTIRSVVPEAGREIGTFEN